MTAAVDAAPWIEPSDVHLRADIQLLADVGVIKAPVNTFPLMWTNVIGDVDLASRQSQPPTIRDAINRVKLAFNREAGEKSRTQVTLSAATDTPRFQKYGTPAREQFEYGVSQEIIGDRWAGRLSVTRVTDAADGDKTRYDGSYLAGTWGNWVYIAGAVDKWWGPGWDTAVTMSTNARPMPSMMISRQHADPFALPVLEWLGPWTFTTGISQFEKDRHVPNALLWTMRATFKPLDHLEFGASRALQLCGDGRDCGVDAFWRGFIGDDNDVSDGAAPQPGNQVASLYARLSHTLFDVPTGIYYEQLGEDANPRSWWPLAARSHLGGVDAALSFPQRDVRVYLEYTDTEASCSFACTYNHHIYKDGYRFNKRALGSTYDGDAKTYTLGLVGFERQSGHMWRTSLQSLRLNLRSDRQNPVTPTEEEVTRFDVSYIFPMFNGRTEVGSGYSYSRFPTSNKSAQDSLDLMVNWKYQY